MSAAAASPEAAEFASAAVSEGERRVAWLRLAAVPIICTAETLPHPNAEKGAFTVAIAAAAAYAVALLAVAGLAHLHGSIQARRGRQINVAACQGGPVALELTDWSIDQEGG